MDSFSSLGRENQQVMSWRTTLVLAVSYVHFVLRGNTVNGLFFDTLSYFHLDALY